jgi:hypothetical protein
MIPLNMALSYDSAGRLASAFRACAFRAIAVGRRGDSQARSLMILIAPHPVTANVVSVISQAAAATAMIAAHLCGARKPGLIYQLSRYFQIAGDAGHPPSLYGYKGWLPCKVVLALFISWKFE